MNQLTKVAIIGCGNIASDYDTGMSDANVYSHAKAFMLNESVDLLAACDPSETRRAKFHVKWGEKVSLYESLGDLLLNHSDLDLISICSPTKNHKSDLLKLLDSDIPYILCEKPFIENVQEIDAILKKFSSKGKVLMVNHLLRWEPGIIQIKNKLSDQNYSDIQGVQVNYAKGLMHNGVHVVDLTLFLFGQPDKIHKISEFEEIHGDPTCDFIFIYSNFSVTFMGLLESSYSIFEYKIYTRKEKFEIIDLTNSIYQYSVIEHPFLNGYKYLSPDPKIIPSFQNQNMSSVINDIVDGIRNDKPKLFRCLATDANETMKCLQIIKEEICLKN